MFRQPIRGFMPYGNGQGLTNKGSWKLAELTGSWFSILCYTLLTPIKEKKNQPKIQSQEHSGARKKITLRKLQSSI